jgi:hypothetical protein
MTKKHDTFPNEQPEMPMPMETPEVKQLFIFDNTYGNESDK